MSEIETKANKKNSWLSDMTITAAVFFIPQYSGAEKTVITFLS